MKKPHTRIGIGPERATLKPGGDDPIAKWAFMRRIANLNRPGSVPRYQAVDFHRACVEDNKARPVKPSGTAA